MTHSVQLRDTTNRYIALSKNANIKSDYTEVVRT